ncbi:MAG: hypothetical protein ACREK1_01155 [Longimicrobiales bacterium]
MTAARCLLVLWLTGLCGCYTYDPARLADVRAEMRVRARLSEEEVARLGSVVPSDGRVIEGEVLERAAGELLLLVPVTSDVVGTRVETLHQRLRIPDRGIIEIESRRLDRLKTALVLSAGVAVAGGIAAAALTGGYRSDRTGNGGTPPEMVIPVGFSIRFGR